MLEEKHKVLMGKLEEIEGLKTANIRMGEFCKQLEGKIMELEQKSNRNHDDMEFKYDSGNQCILAKGYRGDKMRS